MHRAHPFQRHGAGFWKDGSVLKGGDQPKYILYKGTIPALHTPEKWLPEGYCISWFPTEGQEKIGILTLSCPPTGFHVHVFPCCSNSTADDVGLIVIFSSPHSKLGSGKSLLDLVVQRI